MGCQCSINKNNDIIKEQLLNHETNSNKSNLKNLNNFSNNLSNNENTIDTNFSRDFSKKSAFQNNMTLIYQMFENINKIRTNPMSMIEKIEMYKSKIFKKDNQILIDCGNKVYSLLNKGEIIFNDCIKCLYSQKSLEPLELNNNLKIEINLENIKKDVDYTSFEFIEQIFKKKFEETKNNCNILGFHYDICNNNTELSSILQIVDDTGNNFSRRKNILNEKARFVGISFVNIKRNLFCYYLVFANKKNN